MDNIIGVVVCQGMVYLYVLSLYDQLPAALLIGRNAVMRRSSLSNDERVGGRPCDIAVSHCRPRRFHRSKLA